MWADSDFQIAQVMDILLAKLSKRTVDVRYLDRSAKEGVGFTDYYAQQSCTAGRAAFIGG